MLKTILAIVAAVSVMSMAVAAEKSAAKADKAEKICEKTGKACTGGKNAAHNCKKGDKECSKDKAAAKHHCQKAAAKANICEKNGADFALSEVFAKGGDGGIELAEKVVAACEKPSDFRVLYPDEMPIKEKIETVAKKIYGADGVNFEPNALKSLAAIEALDDSYKLCPVCMAKTSFTAATCTRPISFALPAKSAITR